MTIAPLDEIEQLGADLALLSESGKAPKSRAISAKVIRGAYNKMLEDDEASATARVRTQGMKDGDPPYSPAALRAQGQASRANANFLQGAKIIQRVCNGYNDIIFSPKTLLTVDTEFGEEAERFEYNRILSEELSRTIRK